MAFTVKAGELAAECAASEYAIADLRVGCAAPDHNGWSDLYAAPSVNPDGSIALPLIDWPSTNARVVNVDPSYVLSIEVLPG